ncbi:hypothetical protein [Pendulispora albinea]|uniref:Uncharacterized protein n=1 Tax=Pendulispora albinea TaxID=2741071 RepID=A0ABZ2LNT3_9BACT
MLREGIERSYLSLARARTLPEGTRERAVAEFAMRLRWHTLFDPCPRVLALAPPDGADIFRRFSDWLDQAKPSMDWTLHLHLLAWLLRDPPYAGAVDEPMVIELLAAAASKWAIFDRGPREGIVLGSERVKKALIVGWKCRAPDTGRTIEVATLAGDLELESLVGYAYAAGGVLESVGPLLPVTVDI